MEARIVSFAKSSDPFFNSKAAQEAYDLVMKMDDDEARVFTSMVVGDRVVELIKDNRRSLQSHLDGIVTKRVDAMKAAAKQTIINKAAAGEEFDEQQALATLGALESISKAIKNPYAYGYVFNEADFRRGRDGRFTTKIKRSTGEKHMTDQAAATRGIPEPMNTKSDGKGRYAARGLTAERRAMYQQQYLQVAAALDLFSDDDNASIVVRNNNKRSKDFGMIEERSLNRATGVGSPGTELEFAL